MSYIYALKVHKLRDTGSEYVRWIDVKDPYSMQDEKDEVDFSYNEGRRFSFKFFLSDNSVDTIVDLSSDLKAAEDLTRDIYNLALIDASEALGLSKDHLQDLIYTYNSRKF